MISYEVYKIIHLVSLALILIGLSGALFAFQLKADLQKPMRSFIFMCHGLGLALLLVSGFGLLARLGLFGAIPAWAWGKITLWLIAGGLIAAFKRQMIKTPWGILIIVVVVGTAATLAVTKLI